MKTTAISMARISRLYNPECSWFTAMAGIVTLTAGSSGTLVTIMAANYNIVPVALLNMRDPYGVIKFQLPYAAVIRSCHVLLLWGLVRAL